MLLVFKWAQHGPISWDLTALYDEPWPGLHHILNKIDYALKIFNYF